MSTLLKPFWVRAVLLEKRLFVFTLHDFQRVFRTSKLRAKYFLETYTRAGLFVRLKRGLYALQEHLPSEEVLANLLYRPSYISFEYALAGYGLLPEMVYSVTCATPKPTRTFTVAEKPFVYYTIKQEAFTGYAPLERKDGTVLMAEPEKALVDYLYFVALGKKPWNDRLRETGLNRDKLQAYARLYRRQGLEQLIREKL